LALVLPAPLLVTAVVAGSGGCGGRLPSVSYADPHSLQYMPASVASYAPAAPPPRPLPEWPPLQSPPPHAPAQLPPPRPTGPAPAPGGTWAGRPFAAGPTTAR